MIKSFFLFAILVIVSSCAPERTLHEFGPYPVRQIEQSSETTKTNSGWFCVAVGSDEEGESQKDLVKAFAEVNGRYQLFSMPMEDVRIVLSDTIKTPYIKIEYMGYNSSSVFSEQELISSGFISNVRLFIIHCHPELLPEKLLSIGL